MEPTGARVRKAGKRHPANSPKLPLGQRVKAWFLKPGGEGQIREVSVNQHVVGFDADDGQWFPIRLIRRIGMAAIIRFDRLRSHRKPRANEADTRR